MGPDSARSYRPRDNEYTTHAKIFALLQETRFGVMDSKAFNSGLSKESCRSNTGTRQEEVAEEMSKMSVKEAKKANGGGGGSASTAGFSEYIPSQYGSHQSSRSVYTLSDSSSTSIHSDSCCTTDSKKSSC